MHYDFQEILKGPLAQLVRYVATISAEDRARMVIDVAGGTTLNVAEIMNLAQREDMP